MPFAVRLLPALAVAGALLASPALAQRAPACQNTGAFEDWLAAFKQEAAAQKISARTIETAFAGVTLDQSVIQKDRRQGVFRQSFEEFSGRMIPPRLAKGRAMLKTHAGTLARIEQTYGVPGPVVVAIWGLETDFGAVKGQNMSTIRSLATLAYDCRRSAFFRAQLMDALRVLERGDLSITEMRGGWAGELGQTQFLPSAYFNYAVDFDGNGKRDLFRSSADVLASTANYLRGHGWQKGQPWTPGTTNFQVIQLWNKSQVYSQTVAAFASRLAGN